MRTIIGILILSASWLQAAMSLNSSFYSSSLAVPSGVVVSNFYATNYGSPLAWYVADNATMTGSTNAVGTWPDGWVNSWSLTNPSSWATCPLAKTNSLNGHHTLQFDGIDDFLRCANYTNTQPHEIWMVAAYRGVTNSLAAYFFESMTAARQMARKSTTDKMAIYAGTIVNDGQSFADLTNKWFVLTVVFNGTKSLCLTNNVLRFSGDAGANTMGGITIANFGLSGFCPLEVSEIATYSATNSNASRSDIYSGLTNKYGVANF